MAMQCILCQLQYHKNIANVDGYLQNLVNTALFACYWAVNALVSF